MARIAPLRGSTATSAAWGRGLRGGAAPVRYPVQPLPHRGFREALQVQVHRRLDAQRPAAAPPAVEPALHPGPNEVDQVRRLPVRRVGDGGQRLAGRGHGAVGGHQPEVHHRLQHPVAPVRRAFRVPVRRVGLGGRESGPPGSPLRRG